MASCGSVEHAKIIRSMIDNGRWKDKCGICGATITVGYPADFKDIKDKYADNEADKKPKKSTSIG